ncbi:tyrosine-type recombinase/integrase [Brevibacillus centrosporus]|uniref:tyrosine-type recombinase/integrase n=1 Tax=Brevibacillus centrosporus TaxID=54910 RepID=UPI002E223FF4|nr:tyrosine-type recombinase/integrase [Brevibacillus centrosporus]MED1953574.1 tyrosine-type recombinase/integrase [Brevibacillus centrosporus]
MHRKIAMHERPQDETEVSTCLFLTAAGIPSRLPDAQMDKSSINRILAQIGKWHDAEQPNPERHLSPLRPHDLRQTFAFMLANETGGDRFELQRRLGHRSDKYIEIYTNPPEEVAAQYIEKL